VADDAEGNFGSGIEEAAAGEVAVLVVNVDEIAGSGVGRDLTEEAGKDGGLKGEILKLRPR
jgi:hypothetical protein